MKPDASSKFVVALEVFRQAESTASPIPLPPNGGDQPKLPPEVRLMQRYQTLLKEKKIDTSASVASLMQVLGHEDGKTRLDLAKYLDTLPGADATRALARLAIFSAEADIRAAAVSVLKARPQGLHRSPAVRLELSVARCRRPCKRRAAKLARKELVPQLIDVLERPDPRTPQTREVDGKKATVVRELVRVNHHHNCLLCHAPMTAKRFRPKRRLAWKS